MPRWFGARAILFAAVRELIPFFPVYPLLFADTGLSTAEISSLFIIWSATAFLLEVPSGALADLVPRRLLLCAATVVYAAGFAAWTAVAAPGVMPAGTPTYPFFALGFVLWGISSAAFSGTYESYVFDVLSEAGEQDRFPRVLSLARSGGFVMVLVATLSASVLYPLGGYQLVGMASLGACLVQLLIGLTLPADPRTASAPRPRKMKGVLGPYLIMLREGFREAHGSPPVRGAVIVVALIAGLLGYDEYFPLLAKDLGASQRLIPILLAGTVAVQAAGAALAHRVSDRLLGPAVLAAAGLLIIGSLADHPAGFAVIAIGYGLQQMIMVRAEIRLQQVVQGRARATVTSISGLLQELSALSVFAGFALGSLWLPVSGVMVVLAVVLLALAPVTSRLLRAKG